MKWFEKKYRQSKVEFFVMRSLPWHLTHVVRLQPSHQSFQSSEKLFQSRIFCHFFDNCIQDHGTVISILQDILIRLKQDHHEIEAALHLFDVTTLVVTMELRYCLLSRNYMK